MNHRVGRNGGICSRGAMWLILCYAFFLTGCSGSPATTGAPTFTAPSNLTATAASTTQINLSWTAATETGGTISQYLIERCQGSGCSNFAQVATSPTTTFNDTTSGLTGSTAYNYRVRPTDAANNLGPYSNTASATTPANTPTAPTSLIATASGPVQINLSWTAATETGGTISQYLIERCTGATCTNFVQVATSPTTTFNDTTSGLTGSTTYNYRVRAQDSSNNTGPYSNTASATTAAPTFTAPSNLTATASGPVQINLSWTAATETGGTISQYLIERCTGATCTNLVQIATSPTTTFNDTTSGLSGSTTYNYRVRATDAANNLGPYSNTASATTGAPTFTPPSNLMATAASTAQINLSWTAATETGGTISQYVIQRCQGAGCTLFAQVGTSTTTSFNDTGLTASTSYSYEVQAKDAAGNLSGFSNIATAITLTSAIPALVHSEYLSNARESGNDFQISYGGATGTGTLSGNLLALYVVFPHGSTVSAITDNKSSTYTLAESVDSGVNGYVMSLYFVSGALAGINQITVTFTASVGEWHGVIEEYNNVAAATPLDGVCSSSTTASPMVQCGGGFTTTQAGDLILAGAIDLSEGLNTLGGGSPVTAITAGNASTLTSSDFGLGGMNEFEVQGVAGPVTPSFSVTQGAFDTFDMVAVAFKSAPGGTAPTGATINHQYTLRLANTSQHFAFPSTGNLLVMVFDDSNNNTSGNVISSITTSPSNPFTPVSPNSSTPQIFYVCSATTATTLTGTITNGIPGTPSNTALVRMYDVGGMAAACHDTDSTNGLQGTQAASNADITGAPDLTPTTQPGIAFGVMNIGVGPSTGVIGTGFIFDNTHYTGETDSGFLNNGDSWSHVFYTSTSQLAFGYHMSNGTASSWNALAVAFKSASAP